MVNLILRVPFKLDILTTEISRILNLLDSGEAAPFTPMGEKPDLFDIQHNNVVLFSGLNIVIRCSYLSIGLSIITLCGGSLTADGIPTVKYNQWVMTYPIGGCWNNQGITGNKKGSTANATLLNIGNFTCRKFLDVKSNLDKQCCIVQIVGTHNLFSSCLTACVLSLYSALIASSSAERDSYLAVMPFEINKLTTVFISSAVLSSSGNMLLVFPVNSESMCLQNVFAGQLQETPICPDTSNNSTLYMSFLLLLNARNLNVIAMSLIVNAQKINGYFFFCDFCLDNFISQASITQDEKLTVFFEEILSFIANSISSINSCGKRIPLYCDLLFLCPVAIEIIQSKCFNTIKNTVNMFSVEVFKQIWLDVFKQIEVTYLNTLINVIKKKQSPISAVNTDRASNHSVKESYDMAMYKSTQTHPKFIWRFFSCQQFKYFLVEASNEQEARSMLPDSPCIFSARICQGVIHG